MAGIDLMRGMMVVSDREDLLATQCKCFLLQNRRVAIHEVGSSTEVFLVQQRNRNLWRAFDA